MLASKLAAGASVVVVVLVLVVLVLVVLVLVVGGSVVVVVGLGQSKPRAWLFPLFWACTSHARSVPVEPLSLGPTPSAPADTKLVPVKTASITQAVPSSRFNVPP